MLVKYILSFIYTLVNVILLDRHSYFKEHFVLPWKFVLLFLILLVYLRSNLTMLLCIKLFVFILTVTVFIL